MITKEKFDTFVKLQKSGIINMTDIVKGAKITHMSEDDYFDIVWNYKQYKEQFKQL